MCKALYSVPDFIPVRDKYVKISRQFDQGTFSFHVQDGTYNFKHFRRGQLIENKDVDFKEFYKLVETHCDIKFNVEPFKVKEATKNNYLPILSLLARKEQINVMHS